MPERIKVDNGRPFGNPQRDLPPPLALWLVGHAVEVVHNRPRHPQDNATVENLQGTSSRWSEPHRCASAEELQQRLNENARLQRTRLRTRVLSGRTRLEVYPELEQNARRFAAEDFDYERVAAYLAEGSYVRKVASNGRITLYGHPHQVGLRYRGQKVRVEFDAEGKQWQVFDRKGDLAKTLPVPYLGSEQVINLSIGQRTDSG
jgi:hypothetical protein